MKTTTPVEAWNAVRNGRGTFVDVREPGEYDTVCAPGSINVPLSRLEERIDEIPGGRDVYLLCASGSRADAAAAILKENGRNPVVVTGGILAWEQARLPLDAGDRRVWSMDRQVRFGAGLMILTGLGLGWFAHPGYLLIAAWAGLGLTISGLTGFCGMAYLLARCPWNKR